MNIQLTTYSARLKAITQILSDAVEMSEFWRTNYIANEFDDENGLNIYWTHESAASHFFVAISMIESVDAARSDVMHMVHVDLGPTDMSTPNEHAYEIAQGSADRYVAVLDYCSRLVVVLNTCRVDIGLYLPDVAPNDLVEPAFRIAREIGCSPYEDDITPPQLPEEWRSNRWTIREARDRLPPKDSGGPGV